MPIPLQKCRFCPNFEVLVRFCSISDFLRAIAPRNHLVPVHLIGQKLSPFKTTAQDRQNTFNQSERRRFFSVEERPPRSRSRRHGWERNGSCRSRLLCDVDVGASGTCSVANVPKHGASKCPCLQRSGRCVAAVPWSSDPPAGLVFFISF